MKQKMNFPIKASKIGSLLSHSVRSILTESLENAGSDLRDCHATKRSGKISRKSSPIEMQIFAYFQLAN